MKKNRLLPILGIFLILFLFLFIAYRLWTDNDDNSESLPNNETVNQGGDSSAEGENAAKQELTPEEVIATLEGEKPAGEHNLELSIIGPEGETIFPGQARNYKAYLQGNTKYESAKIDCHWQFYLNENNEEVLFEEMNNTSSIGYEAKEVCGFTSTFIDKQGELRIVLDITLKNFRGDELETTSAEREYLVAR